MSFGADARATRHARVRFEIINWHQQTQRMCESLRIFIAHHTLCFSGSSSSDPFYKFQEQCQLADCNSYFLRLIHLSLFIRTYSRRASQSLLNTDVKREIDHLAAFLRLAVEHQQAIGFGGQLLIEPKPKEPTAHQLRFDLCFVFCGGGLFSGVYRFVSLPLPC